METFETTYIKKIYYAGVAFIALVSASPVFASFAQDEADMGHRRHASTFDPRNLQGMNLEQLQEYAARMKLIQSITSANDAMVLSGLSVQDRTSEVKTNIVRREEEGKKLVRDNYLNEKYAEQERKIKVVNSMATNVMEWDKGAAEVELKKIEIQVARLELEKKQRDATKGISGTIKDFFVGPGLSIEAPEQTRSQHARERKQLLFTYNNILSDSPQRRIGNGPTIVEAEDSEEENHR